MLPLFPQLRTHLSLHTTTTWLQTLRQRRTRRRLDREQAALEACASEGAEIDLRTVEFDGQHFGALYRNGELICLLPRIQDH